MFIKSLKLVNFQKHSNLQLDFVNGVNILFGSSDAGKSCIRRALEWIVQNENLDGIRKTGTKKTSVSIILDNDVEIERIRSQSINRYVLREGKDEQVFDSIGKNIPEPIKEKLTIYPIEVDGEDIYLNSQPQIALPFLFDKSPSFRMKLFNKLTGNDVLDALFGGFNKDILRIKRGFKEETERFEERALELKEKRNEKEKAEAVFIRLKRRVKNVKLLHEKYSKLLEIQNLQKKVRSVCVEIKDALKGINIPEDIKHLKEKIEHYERVKEGKNGYEKGLVSLERVRGQLEGICVPEVDYGVLRGKIERVEGLKGLQTSRQNRTDVYYQMEKVLHETELELCDKKDEYKELLKEAKVCPICQGEITEECLRGIEL